MSLAKKVSKAIRRGDSLAVIDLLIAAPEKERRAIFEEVSGSFAGHRQAPQQLARTVAILGTGTTRDIRNAWGTRGVPDEAVELVLARPKNIRDGIIKLGVEHEFSNWLWPIVYELVKRGEIEQPDHEGYVLGVLPAVYNPVWMGIELINQWWGPTTVDDLERRLRHDPELIELSLHAIQNDLEGGHLWGVKLWFQAYPRLVGSGHIDRDRMLDLCLEGYLSDFRPVMSRNFGELWKDLEPSTAEVAARAGRLEQLVTSRDTGAQKLGMAEITKLLKVNQIDDLAPVAEACRNPLGGTQKNLATAALRILKLIARTEPGAAVSAACVGLGHPRADIQEASLDLIEQLQPRVDDPTSLTTELLAWMETVAPQMRSRLEALVGMSIDTGMEFEKVDLAEVLDRLEAAEAKAPRAFHVRVSVADLRAGKAAAPLRFQAWAAPVLTDANRIEPVASVDELVEVLTAVLTGSVDGVDIERALDGMARFADERLDTTAMSTIERNLQAMVRRFGGLPGLGVVTPILSWAKGQAPEALPFVRLKSGILRKPSLRGELVTLKPLQVGKDGVSAWMVRSSAYDGTQVPANFEGVGLSRAWEVAIRCIERSPQPLLSLPTHIGGWIEPAGLAARLESIAGAGGTPDRFDACQAVLRLAPIHDERAVQRLRTLKSPVARAALALLDESEPPPDEGLRRASVATVDLGTPVVVNEPPEQPNHSPIVGIAFPDAAKGVELRRDDAVGMALTKLGRPRRDAYWWSATSAVIAQANPARMSWATLTTPRSPDILGAAAAMGIAPDMDSNRSSDAHDIALGALLPADTPLGVGSHTGIAVALSARNEAAGTVAIDLTAEAAADGRLDPEMLGGLLAQLTNGGLAGLARSAARLAQVGQMSALHADQVRLTINALLSNLHPIPRDVHAILEVLVAVGTTVQRGVPDFGVVSALEDLHAASPRSKRGKLAKAALDLPRKWSAGLPEAMQAEALLDRIDRWQRSRQPSDRH